jgi:hypothetical protein
LPTSFPHTPFKDFYIVGFKQQNRTQSSKTAKRERKAVAYLIAHFSITIISHIDALKFTEL